MDEKVNECKVLLDIDSDQADHAQDESRKLQSNFKFTSNPKPTDQFNARPTVFGVERRVRRSSLKRFGREEMLQEFLVRGVDYRGNELENTWDVVFTYEGTFWQIMFSYFGHFADFAWYLVLCSFNVWILPLLDVNLDELDIATNSASLQNLSIFCLALGLSTNVGRWWSMNENGVSPIMNSNNKIAIRMRLGWDAMVKSERYHDNPEYQLKMIRHILNIQRYFEGALTLLFCEEPTQIGFSWKEIEAQRLFTAAELHELKCQYGGDDERAFGEVMPQCVFTWIAQEIEAMYDEDFFLNKTDGRRHKAEMIGSIFRAQDASGCIGTFLSAYLPYLYRHFNSYLVKLTNFFVCFALKQSTGHYAADIGRVIIAMLIVISFNTILLLTTQLHNPFDDGFGSFPGKKWRLQMVNEFRIMFRMDLDEMEKELVMRRDEWITAGLDKEWKEKDAARKEDKDEDEDDDDIDDDDDDQMLMEMMGVY